MKHQTTNNFKREIKINLPYISKLEELLGVHIDEVSHHQKKKNRRTLAIWPKDEDKRFFCFIIVKFQKKEYFIYI